MILHGRDVLIMTPVTSQGTTTDQAVVAGAKSCEINVSADIIEVSSPTSGTWREYIPGRKSWALSISNLVPAGDMPTEKEMVGKTIFLKLYERDSGAQLQGNAIVTDWRAVATLGNLSQGSFKFIGNGELITPPIST